MNQLASTSTGVSRRRVLMGGAALVAIGSAGTLWLALRSANARDWIEAVVRKNLPNVRLDPVSLDRFAARLAGEPEFQSKKIELAVGLDSMAPVIVRIAPEVNRKIERLERFVISNYLLGSNFFRVADPLAETIFCDEPILVCGNPFARFRSS